VAEYVLSRDEDGVHLCRDGDPLELPSGIETVHVHRDIGRPIRLEVITGCGGRLHAELEPFVDSLRVTGWHRSSGVDRARVIDSETVELTRKELELG
jgi:hypothetical protein